MKKILIVICAGAALFLSLAYWYYTKQEKKLSELIYPHVYLDTVHIGEKTKSEVENAYEKKYQYLQNVTLQVLYDNQIQATFSAEQIGLQSNYGEILERAFLIGRSSKFSSRLYQKIAAIFNLANFHFTTKIGYNKDSLEDFVIRMKDNYAKPAKNALFSFENGRVVSFRKEENGTRIEIEKFYTVVDAAVNTLSEQQKILPVLLTSSVIEPEITLAKTNQFGIEELIGEGVSDFSHSIPERIHNVALATSKFNGVLIPKDALFSFNEILGDVSSLTGYKPAYIIKSGRTVLGDGGGVCQVSTTMFRAALNTGLPIQERTAHAYRVGYYENDSKPGFDATVFAPSVDLKIKNDTPAYILIQTSIDKEKNTLAFRLYGKKDGRAAEISSVALYDVQQPPPPLYQDDPTLQRGIVKQIDFPAWGGRAKFDYKVTKNNETIFQKQFFSSYRPWQAVYMVGIKD